jgi:DNA-binding SARP family transcriptional activator/tetratricopeptide (TPR) repeat protein
VRDAVEFELLGPVAARFHHDELPLGSPKQAGVLAVLLLHANHPISASAIIDAVWDDRPPANGPNVVSKYVSRLRRVLSVGSVPVLSRTRAGYLARADSATLDLAAFEQQLAQSRELRRSDDLTTARDRLATALARWHGVPLAGLAGSYFRTARERLLDQYLVAMEERLEIDLALGRHAEVLVELTGLVNEHPLRERLAAQLMLALYRTGRQSDSLAAFHRLRIALADELGIDPGADASTLHERILRQDPDLTESRSAGTYPGTTGPIPAQLRHGISNFIGRTEQLAELHTMLDEQHTTMLICAIDGAAGIGKTEFALHFAHQISDRFPDGQLYLDLHGFSPDDAPVAPEEALGQSLRALGADPARIPADVTERASLYRSMLAGRRVLVVLDNARDPEQVRPLLPGSPTTLVLVTSRKTMAGLVVRDGARRITLDVMPVAESVDLLIRIIGPDRIAAESREAHDLVALCGQLPLALRIVAHRIAAQPQLRLADLVAELRTERDRLDVLVTEGDETSAVRSVFSWSYRTLTLDVASAFRLLSLHPGSEFGLPVASAILAVPLADARRLLSALTGAHLVHSDREGRYQSHDLMRLYALERAVAEETECDRAAAVRRALEWYLGNADAAGAVLVPHRRRAELSLSGSMGLLTFGSTRDALDWCETERTNLLAAQHQAIEVGLDTLAWQMAVSLWDFYFLRSYWVDWIDTHELALPAARRGGDRTGEAGVLTSLGHAYLEAGRFTDAVSVITAALECWREIPDQWGEGITLHLLASTIMRLGRLAEAEHLFDQALRVHDQTGNRWGAAWSLATQGTLYRAIGAHQRALDSAQRARVLWHDLGDQYGETFVLNDLGDIFLQLRQFDQAGESYRDAVALSRQIGNRWGEATGLAGVGDTAQQTGHDEVARESWRRALVIFERIGDPTAEAIRQRLRGPYR